MSEHFRGVVWPKQQGNVHRYVIVGMILTDKAIPEFDGKNEIVLDGRTWELLRDTIPAIPQKVLEFPSRLGDANDVLTSMEMWQFVEPDDETDDVESGQSCVVVE